MPISCLSAAIPCYGETKASTPLKEWFRDIVYPIQKIFKESLLNPFNRPLLISIGFRALTDPQFSAQTSDMIRITRKAIACDEVYDNNEKIGKEHLPSAWRLFCVLNRVEELAKKMGITKPIELYLGSEAKSNGSTFLSAPARICISTKDILSDDDELEFVLCHELAHIKHNDTPKMVAFNTIALLIELIALPIFPLIFLVIEPTIKWSDYYLFSRGCEQRADLAAIRVLQSNQGAVKHFKRLINENLSYKKMATELLDAHAKRQTELSPMIQGIAHTLNDETTPDGNNRMDFNHPSLTSRLATALRN